MTRRRAPARRVASRERLVAIRPSSNAVRARGGKGWTRGRRRDTHEGTSSRTRRSSGASRRWSCLCRRREGRERGGSARVRRSGGRRGPGEGRATRPDLPIAQILKKTRQACSFPAPTMRRRGGSRTGTAVTDEDQLERGRLSHLSFLRAGAGNVGGGRHSPARRGATRVDGLPRGAPGVMKKRRANPRRDARVRGADARGRTCAREMTRARAFMRLPRACKVSERLADSIVSTLSGDEGSRVSSRHKSLPPLPVRTFASGLGLGFSGSRWRSPKKIAATRFFRDCLNRHPGDSKSRSSCG